MGNFFLFFLRIARSTLLSTDFLPVASKLHNRMINQGGSKVRILRQISKAVSRHPEPFVKFSKHAREIVHDITAG